MKKILISLVSILASCCFSFATAVTKSVELGYKQSSFSFTYDSSGYLQIIPQDGIYAYDENTDNLKKGVLGISLIVNSKLADSINIENK